MATTTTPRRASSSGGGAKPLVDDATLHQWTETGAQHIVSKLTHALKDTSASDALIAPDSDLYRLFYELVWIVVHAKLTRHDVVSVLKDAELASYPDACDTFLDLVWIIGNEVEANEKGRERHSSAEWQQLCRFVKALADDAVVPVFSLKASLEYDLLHAAGLVSEPQLMRKKLLRINTKALYTQMKYNLLREESEGFAKVLSLVHTNVTPEQLDATQTDLLALIGYFDLDANRVLDLVLDAYEAQPTNDCFATLLGAFKRASLPHVLGFKFQFYKRDATDGLVTPRSLYRLAATLVAKRLVDVDALLPHLAPSKDAIVAQYAARTQALEAAAQAFGKVNLTAKATDSAADGKDKSAHDEDADEHNQVFGLIVGLLEIGADARAFELIAWFQSRGVNPLAYKPLSAQLCASVHALIAPLYAPLSLQTMQLVARTSSSSSAKTTTTTSSSSATTAAPVTTPETLVAVVFPILEMLGGQLHHDPLLFTKLLRIISHAVERAPKAPAADASAAITHEQLLARVHTLIVKSFLPAVTHLGSNPSAVFQLWDLVKLYPFEQRYRMYEQWQAAYATDPEMKLVDAQVVQATRKVMRRLTADRAKPSARSLTHFAHANPLTVFRTMLRQIQSYDNLIQPVVESFKFITPLGMDVLSFVLVRELATSRQAMKADGTNISLWLASLASFAGSFYRKYPTVELSGLLQYLIQRLRNWESVDLVVLSELLSKMGSCISFEDISLSQLEALAGGPHLGHEPTDPKLMNRRAIPRLRDALVKRDLALPLVLLICQMRSRIEHHEGSPQTHLKLLGRVYDTCQMTLSQLLQFLHSVVDPAAYTAMLPSLTSLVREYHIQPELAMTLCRPAMRSDDPVLRRAPRSIHATGASASANGSAETPARWCIDAPELLADVRAAVLTAQDSAAATTDDNAFSGMTPDLYVTFWSLVLYDIYVPFAQYEAEIVRLRTSLTAPGGVNNASLSGTERKKLKEKTTQRIDKLTNEQKDQVAHRKRVFERLEATKRAFFAREDNRSAVHALLQTCVIPRALLSPEDALFCAKFMERLHAIDTPEFSTLQYYNTVNLKLPSIVLCVTEREAGNFGIFLKETLHVLARWYQSAVAYEEDAVHGKSGFSVDLHDPTKTLPHRQYKLVFAKWHKWMAKVFAATLASSEYMPMRNTLIVLTKIIDVFPASKSTAERLLAIVEGLTKEDREDIKIMAKRYFALLTKRKGTLVEDKLLALASVKKAAAVTAAATTGKDTSAATGDNDNGDEEGAATDPAKPSLRASASAASDAPKTSASESSSRDRKTARVLRQDLESGEISTPPPSSSASTAPPAGRSSSSSSRRSSERPSSIAATTATESARERENRPSSSSSGSRLKRRDSDRSSGVDESNASSGRPGDEKRGRREARDGREGREGREASPGKPPLASSVNNNNSSMRGNGADAPASGGRKRDRSRERRSRSSDARRNGRERNEAAAAANAPASTAPVTTTSKETSNSSSSSSSSAGRSSEALKRESDDASGESRKRQRLELSEAQLRRQLTEKKDQEQRRERMDASGSSNKSDLPAARSSESSVSAVRSGGDAERSERPQTSSSAPAGAGSSMRKMVSLVSTSRKREDDGDRVGSGSAATPGAPENADDRRRRDSGRGSGGGGGGGHGSRGGDSSDSKQRGMQDEKKRSRRDRKHVDGNGSVSTGNGQQQQQRDQSRGGGGGGGHDRRGGQGRSGDGGRGDGGGRGNEDRSGGGGGGGRRREDRRGRR